MATSRKRKRAPGAVSADTEATVPSVAGWTVARIELAKRMADRGDLSYAADLWERVMGDERAIGPLQAIAGVGAVEVSFEPATGDDTEDPLVDAISEDWPRFFPEELQGEILRWSAGLGVALTHVKTWQPDDDSGRWIPEWSVWHARALVWDGSVGSWKVKTKENSSGVEITTGDSEFVLFTPYGSSRPWSKAPWYGLGLLWFAAQCSKINWAAWNDTHASPVRVASNEKAETHGIIGETEQQALVTKIKSLVRGGAIVLPDGYDLKLVEAATRNWESFVKLCDEVWPKAVAIALTGNNLSTQIEGGSFAASRTAENVTYDRKRTFARCLETTVRRDALTWWADYNFGTRAAPWPHYAVEPPRDLVSAATRFSQGAQGLATLGAAGYEIDDGEEDAVAELLGIRVKRTERGDSSEDEQDPEPKPARSACLCGRQHDTLGLVRAAASDIRSDRAYDVAGSYVDALVEAASYAASEVMAVDVAELMDLIDSATDDGMSQAEALEKLRMRVLEHYGKRMTPVGLVELTEKVTTLAALAGRLSAVESL